MADGVNRVWLSLDLGNYTVGKKASLFFGGDNPREVADRFSSVFGTAMYDELVGKFTEAIADPFAVATANVVAGGLVSGGSPAAASSDGPICKHGPKAFKQGVNSSGKAWKAWMCPAPKGTPDQCAPEWMK